MRCFSFARIIRSGEVYAWGFNESGQIANESFENQLIPITVNHFDGQYIKQISCGCLHSMALTENGQVFSWRDNRFGELDVENNENSNKPKLIRIETLIKKISYFHNLLLSWNGDPYVFGQFDVFSLGNAEENQLIAIKMNSNKFLNIALFHLSRSFRRF
jgi:alpha-tubulin suppressor-like RCC1 family protein